MAKTRVPAASLRDSPPELLQYFSKVDNEVGKQTQDLTAVKAAAAALALRVTAAEEDIAGLDARADSIDATIAILDGRVDSVESDAALLNNRVTLVASATALLGYRVAAIEAVNSGLDGRIDDVEAAITALDGRLDDAETAITDLDGRLDDAETAITDLDGRLDDAEEAITTLDGRMNDAEEAITTLDGRVDDAEEAITALDGRIDALELGAYTHATATTLTESAATGIVQIGVAAGTVIGGELHWTIEANDGTDYQVSSGRCRFAAVNKGGTFWTNLALIGSAESNCCSSGTLSNTPTIVNDTTSITLKLTAASSLTQTTLRARWRLLWNGTATTVTAL